MIVAEPGAPRIPAQQSCVLPAASHRRAGVLATSLALVAAIAVADAYTGYEIRLSILYLAPIALATWFLGRAAGILIAVLAATGWLLSFLSAHLYSHVFYLYWEGVIIVATYVLFVLLLSRLKEALANSDDRFAKVIDGLDAMVFVEDAETRRILFANPKYRERFGPAGDRPAVILPDSDGEVRDPASARWYTVRNRPLRWIDGRAVTLRLLTEITEEKRARELMARHRDAGHRVSRLIALGEFASAVAHELNQPLAAIATYNNTCLRILSDPRGAQGDLREAMEKCRDQARRAGEIIHRLRELIRRPGLCLAAHDLNAIARAAIGLAEPEAADAGVEIELTLARAPVQVMADPMLVEQVVLNLLRNAIDATRRKPACNRIAVRVSASPNGEAALDVADLSDGVPPDIVPRLFEAFVSDKPGGMGLGLSICRSVIEAHGGAMHYAPRAEGGSVFGFRVPARAA
jgi:C4-dicarboxylate-specific signal transduction histidine kinase